MREKGKLYEDLAEQHLKKKGYQLLTKNFQCKTGEIDLIMRKDRTLSFVEVRFRQNIIFGTPEETITRSKQLKIIKSAQKYISDNNLWFMDIRFDVIGITQAKPNKLDINWIPNAFN